MMKLTSRKPLGILLALVMLFSLVPAMSGTAYAASTTVIITQSDFAAGVGRSFTKDGVTVTADYMDPDEAAILGGGTFSTTLGNFTKIQVTCRFVDASGAGWSGDTWTGNASSVPFRGDFDGMGRGVTIVCTIELPNVAVTGVSLNKTSTTLTVGGTETLTATVSPDDATDKSVSWASDNTAVATVADGVVTAVAAGTANITVTSNADSTKSASCAVTVNDPTAAAPVITLSDFPETYDGSPKKLISSVAYSGTEDLYLKMSCVTAAANDILWTKYTGPSDLTNVFAPTNAGIYYVYYFVGTLEYLGEVGTFVGQTSIDQARPKSNNFTFTAPNSLNYDGTAKTAMVTIKDGVTGMGEVTVRYYSDADRYNEVAECINPGTYYVGIDVGYGQNYTTEERLYDWYDDSWKFTIASPHTHSFTYSASGATITATCGNTDGGHDGSTTATLTINATGSTYTGSAYAGASLDATAWTAAGLAAPTIEYAGRGSTSYTKSTTAPTDAGDYTASVTVEGQTAGMDFTIGKASITPSVSLDGWIYGETAKTPSVSGNTDNGDVTYTYANKGSTDFSATVPTNAGEYTVKATVAATNNYNGGEATADFTIAKATVTVTAEAKSKTYGEADPALTYTSSGLVGSDTLTGELTREAGENAGTYAIGQGTLTAGDNYTIRYTGANFTINKAAITITADDKSSKYDDDLVELTYTVGGAYKAGDELGVTLNTTATKTSDVGEYPITVSWNENANYTATVTSGKYTITKTGLTVNATGYTGTYDGAAHGISVDVGSSGATVYYAAEALTAENYTTAGSTTNPTYTDAGEYTVYFYVVSGNYDPDTISGSKTVSINKATMTKNELTAAQKPTAKTDLVADNTDQALVTAPASLPEGYTAIQYSLDGETWTDTIPTGKDAGDYTVNYKYVGDSNHNDFQGEPLTVTIKTLTVTFEVNGGSAVEAQSVVKGDTVARPADPTKAGNAFDGWFQDATFSVYFDFAAPVTDDVTLYAKWTPNDYTLTSITGTSDDSFHTWINGSNVSVVLTAKLTTEPDTSFAHFIGVQLDGTTLVRDTDYTAREGSTIVTLVPATLQKLSVGAHTVTILYDNGRADARLTVLQPSSSPKTGDESHAALWLAVLAVSGVGMAATLLGAKKRRMAKR